MIAKLLVISSIILNTIGFKAAALDVDKQLVQREVVPGLQVEASNNKALPLISLKPYLEPGTVEPVIYSTSHLLIDQDSSTVLSSSQPDLKLPIASTTKIMTGILVLEKYSLDDTVIVSSEAASQIGVDLQTYTGEKISIKELLKIMLINSSNRAAYALAEHYNGPDETGVGKFIALMNTKAKELGMNNTNYRDPAGLDVAGYSTAYDLYLVTKYAMKNSLFAQIVGTKTDTATDLSGRIKYQLTNSNRLVNEWNYNGAIGVKTGYMPEASHCLVAAVKRNNHTLISVVLHTNLDNNTASADETKKLMDWGFKYAKWGDEPVVNNLDSDAKIY
jgi:serine-type D-Ala-D-Ala carboxypeptidase (penicillin-binding protein 5/6)